MKSPENNYAFIDAQNLNQGTLRQGWKLDCKRFRVWLRDKFGVTEAFYFIGFLPENTQFYSQLQKWGYNLIFKQTIAHKGIIKGNVDAELVLQAMIELENFDKAVIVTGDGDFACLVRHLRQEGKLKAVVPPQTKKCSTLLKKEAPHNLFGLERQRPKLELKKKGEPRRKDPPKE